MPELKRLLKEIDDNDRLMRVLLEDKVRILSSEDLKEIQWISRLETIKANQDEVLTEFKEYIKEMKQGKRMASIRFSKLQKRQKGLLETLKKFNATQ